jgi:16S rRNA (guanine1516-N2)-methyltransferase
VAEVTLIQEDGRLLLELSSEIGAPRFCPDFSSATMEVKIKDALKRRGLLLRAVEGKANLKNRGGSLKIFDFHSGFAQDAFLLAMAGHEVWSCEKHPLIAKVTQAAWEAQKGAPWTQQAAPRLRLIHGDSFGVLKDLAAENFDVIYMDPMFEKLKQKSKSPLPMQIAQALLREEASFSSATPTSELRLSMSAMPISQTTPTNEDLEQVFTYAKKVVIKSPLKGPPVVQRKPNYQLFGKTIRFDVF